MEEGQQCAVCHEFKDQMIMLTCLHDPCLLCAAMRLCQTKKNSNSQEYVCRLCDEITILDLSSVRQLQKLISQKKLSTARNSNKKISYDRIISIPFQTYGSSEIPKKFDNQTTNRQPRNSQNTQNYKIQKYCRQHYQQQINYYCFKCLENICAECAIHGTHRGHDVKLIKKAISEIKREYLQLIQQMNETQQNYRKNNDENNKQIKYFTQKYNLQKSLIIKEFEIMRIAMSQREKIILKQIQQIHQRNIGLLQTEMQMIKKQHQKAKQFKKEIELTFKKDEILILEEFSQKNSIFKEKIIKYNELNKFEKIAGFKHIELNEIKNMFEKVKISISQLKLTTNDQLQQSRNNSINMLARNHQNT